MQMETNRVGRLIPSLRKELMDYLSDDEDSVEPASRESYYDDDGRPTLSSYYDDDPEYDD